MSEDRYVIVYRDGYVGDVMPRGPSNRVLESAREYPAAFTSLPAYRIHCRERVRPLPHSRPRLVEKSPGLWIYETDPAVARLDPAKAYADAGLRK